MRRRFGVRSFRPALRAVAGLAAALLVAGLVPAVAAAPARADEVTVSTDTLRTGWDQNESSLTAGAVAGSNFGQLFSTAVTGQVVAQPLVIGSTLVVATEDDNVYGLDKVTGAVLWTDNLGPYWPSTTIGCGDVSSHIGVTSTPVYDPSSGYMYVVAEVNDGADVDHPNWKMFAINPATGAQRSGWPMIIQGTPGNDPTRAFNSLTQLQRPGLLLMGGSVYAAFGSFCDYQPYVGYVVGVDTTAQTIHIWSDEVGNTSTGGGIWQAGGGIVSDGPGRMFVSSGNGVSPPLGPGSPVPNQLGQSVVRLSVGSDGTISPADFFSPSNSASLNTNDLDLGSGGPVALPSAEFGTSTLPDLMVEAGKDGRVFLLNRDSLGGRGQGPSGGDAVVQTIGPLAGVWGHPAVWGGDGGYVYLVGSNSNLTALQYGVNGSGQPALSIAGTSAATFGYTSGSPVVTSSGTTSGSALVWEIGTTGSSGANGQLMVYDAVPSNGVLPLIRSFPLGTVSKFSVPATDSGRVYVGTRDGHVFGFGQPTTAALTASPVNFGQVAVGYSSTENVTLTATTTVTVSAVSTATPFTAGTAAPALPATLAAGSTLTVPLTFSPTSPGTATGTLSLTTDQGTIVVGVTGNGTQPGFTVTPSPLAFGQLPIGSALTKTLSITNTGTTPETVGSVTAPTGPFVASGLPAAGAVIQPGASMPVSVTYTPTAAQNDSSSLTIASTDQAGDAHTVTDSITGQGITGVKQMTVTPTTINYGNVALGQSANATFQVSNTGNLPLTISKAAPPTAPFTVADPISEGSTLAPGQTLTVTVTFTPATTGAASGVYQITADTGQGPQPVTITGTGIPPAKGIAVPEPGGDWTLNGSATMSGSNLVLTGAASNESGNAIYGSAVSTPGLQANFTAQLGGGTGADGMTFGLLDAAGASPTGLGGHGGGLGITGLDGMGVALVTYKGTGEPSSNFIGITQLTNSWTLSFVATATNVPNLRAGTHAIGVSVTNCTTTSNTRVDSCTVAVTVDGAAALSAVTNVPANSLPAFTAATGSLNDVHQVSGVSISNGTTTVPAPGGGWSFNGNATMAGSDLSLTQTAANQAGAIIAPTPVAPSGLDAKFTVQIGSGTGGQGMTFGLLTPADVTSSSVGANGAGMGAVGMVGTYVVLETTPIQAALIETVTSSTQTSLTEVQTARGIPNLRAGTHQVEVSVAGDILTVKIDGSLVLQAGATLPSGVLPAFTGSTGTSTDAHLVRGVSITAASYA